MLKLMNSENPCFVIPDLETVSQLLCAILSKKEAY